MRPDPGVLATFGAPPRVAAAIRALRAAGFERVQVAMPAPFPEVVAAIGRPRSAIDYITLPGAAVGLLSGIALTVGLTLTWPLWVGGKPPVSIPAFVVIMFEMTVLVASLTNLGVVGTTTWLGGSTRRFPAHDRFNGEKIGVFVPAGDDRAAVLLTAQGAEEVSRVR